MVVCKFYQEGRCRYGNSCKYEHTGPTTQQQSNQSRSEPQDPFAQKPNRGHQNTSNNQHHHQKPHEPRPLWPLSCVALEGKCTEGNALDDEFSPEEMRVLAYGMAPNGKGPVVTNKEFELTKEHSKKLNALTDNNSMMAGNGQTNASHTLNDPFSNAPASLQQHEQHGGTNGGNGMFGMDAAQANNTSFGSMNNSGVNMFAQAGQMQQPIPQPVQFQQPPPQQITGQDEGHYTTNHFTLSTIPEQAPVQKFF